MFLGREIAIEWIHLCLCAGKSSGKEFLASLYVGLSGQEGKDVAVVLAVSPHHCGSHLFIYSILVGLGVGIDGLHGKHSSGTLDERCMKGVTDGGCVGGGRHYDDFSGRGG